jgi:hypothetical protein
VLSTEDDLEHSKYCVWNSDVLVPEQGLYQCGVHKRFGVFEKTAEEIGIISTGTISCFYTSFCGICPLG